jgi:hypothetical protein
MVGFAADAFLSISTMALLAMWLRNLQLHCNLVAMVCGFATKRNENAKDTVHVNPLNAVGGETIHHQI